MPKKKFETFCVVTIPYLYINSNFNINFTPSVLIIVPNELVKFMYFY